MEASQAAAEREGDRTGTQDAAAATESSNAPSFAWVRPASAVTAALAAAGAGWFLTRTFEAAETYQASPQAPTVGALIVCGMIVAMAASVLVFRPERRTLAALAATSAAWSLALLAALMVAWFIIATTERPNQWHGTRITTSAETDAYLAEHVPAGIDPIRIPTGILVQSLEFLNGDNVQVTGFVWQRYGPDIPGDLTQGIVFPEAIREAYDAKEVYRYEEDGVETVGWYFWATIREPFAYAEYPFDEQNLWLRLWPRDMSYDIVLVPDFASYDTLDPSSQPGVESEFVYSGWSPVFSGFTYSQQFFDTSFGIGDAGEYQNEPELYFNFILDRDFVGPFFEHMVFAIAVGFLLFGLVVLTTDDESLKSRFGLSTAGLLGAASGLLFAVILKHNQLRSAVGNRGISYIESIPVLLYGAIVFVVLNAILLAAPVKPRFIAHRNNLLPVLAFWPVLLGLYLAVTLIIFFGR